jgi:hypothetical protein
MLGHITLVWSRRCRPSPDPVPEGAPSDRHARSVVTGGLWVGGRLCLLPVLRTPLRGVCGIDYENADPDFGGHREQASAQAGGRHAGDDSAEPAPAAVFLAGLAAGEIEILDRNSFDPAAGSPVQKPSEGVPQLGVATSGGAVEVITESAWGSDWIAIQIQPPRGEVIGVHVHANHLSRLQH